MLMPCIDHILCPDCDGNPLANLTAENSESLLPGFCATGYACDGVPFTACSFISQEDAEAQVENLILVYDLSHCPSAPPANFCASAACADGSGIVIRCSPISQEAAQAAANAAAAEEICIPGPPPPPQTPCNTPQTCTVNCPDGTPFSWTVPACTYLGATQQEADGLAFEAACRQATANIICFGPLPSCLCVGTAYTSAVTLSGAGAAGAQIVLDSGSFPTGLGLHGRTISGTPTVAGQFTFTLRATVGQAFMLKTFTFTVLQITTSSLANFTIGSPYSTQLVATGGSGNYAWKISSGQLPTGLTMSISGLISGTPTASDGTNPLVFQVIDLDCESADRSFFPPRISLSGASTTTITTFRGYKEFVGTNGTLYRKCSFSGGATEVATTAAVVGHPAIPIGGSVWSMSGESEIDIFGNFIQHHQKNILVACNNRPWPLWSANAFAGIFTGYCYAPDPKSCSSCPPDSTGYVPAGNFASDDQNDHPLVLTDPQFFFSSQTTLGYNGSANLIAVLDAAIPKVTLNGVLAAWISLAATGNWLASLSEPYTQSDANNSAVIVHSTGLTSETRPNFNTYVANYIMNVQSRNTAVTFSLKCTNLIGSTQYVVGVQLLDSDGTVTFRAYSFTTGESETSHTIADTIPTPSSGHTITARAPSIAFA